LRPPLEAGQNRVLETQNAILDEGGDDVANRISRRTLSKRGVDYADEVRRLLDAGLEVMRRCGTGARPRVADIVGAAGLSNDAFYRHFPSKDALVAAILDDGAERLHGYLTHQMAKGATPEARVRRWVEGVLSQADPEIAATTLAVLWNGGTAGEGVAVGRHPASAALADLLRAPFAELGSPDPELDASLAAHAVLGRLADHLWQATPPTRADVDRITRFCLAAATGPASDPG
jgi:AcrR family transcriptional regulator